MGEWCLQESRYYIEIGGKLNLRVGNAESVLVDGDMYTVGIRTTEGQVLEITPA